MDTNLTEKLPNKDQTQKQTDLAILHKNIKQLLLKKGKNLKSIAEEINIAYPTLHKIVTGHSIDPRISNLKKISDYLNIDLDTLLSLIPEYIDNQLGQFASKKYNYPILDWRYFEEKTYDLNKITNSSDWIELPSSMAKQLNGKCFAIKARRSMHPRFDENSLLIINPEEKPVDGDYILLKLKHDQQATIRQLIIDPPNWYLHSIISESSPINFDKTKHEIIGVVSHSFFSARD